MERKKFQMFLLFHRRPVVFADNPKELQKATNSNK